MTSLHGLVGSFALCSILVLTQGCSSVEDLEVSADTSRLSNSSELLKAADRDPPVDNSPISNSAQPLKAARRPPTRARLLTAQEATDMLKRRERSAAAAAAHAALSHHQLLEQLSLEKDPRNRAILQSDYLEAINKLSPAERSDARSRLMAIR